MIKKIISILLIYFFLSKSVLAADLTITCPADEENCHASGSEFINQSDFFPGFISPAKTLTVINQKLEDECQLKFKIKNFNNSDLAQNFHLDVTNDQAVLFSDYLSTLLDTYQTLDMLLPQSQNTYDWLVSLDKETGNQYQNSNLTFDMDFNFICTPNILGESKNSKINFLSNLLNDDFFYILLFLFTAHVLINIFKNKKIKKPKAL